MGKLNSHAKVGRFFSYDEQSKAFRVYYPEHWVVSIKSDVRFNPNKVLVPDDNVGGGGSGIFLIFPHWILQLNLAPPTSLISLKFMKTVPKTHQINQLPKTLLLKPMCLMVSSQHNQIPVKDSDNNHHQVTTKISIMDIPILNQSPSPKNLHLKTKNSCAHLVQAFLTELKVHFPLSRTLLLGRMLSVDQTMRSG